MDQVQRQQFTLIDSQLIDMDLRVNVTGAALFALNANDIPVTLTIDESADGTTFVPVEFSTPAASGETSKTLVAGGKAVVLFTNGAIPSTGKRYLRIKIAESNAKAGVFCNLFQYGVANQITV